MISRGLSTAALTAAAAFALGACGAPASKTTSNTNGNPNSAANANTSKTASAPPAIDALMAMEKQANEAYLKSDAKYFQDNLSDKFVSYMMGMRMGRDELSGMVAKSKCTAKGDLKLEDPQMSRVNDDTYAVSYRSSINATCTGADGKDEAVPSPTRAVSVWTRSGDKWVGVYHGENLIIDPKNPPKPAAAPAKKDEEKKPDAEKKDAAAPSKPTPGANTEALVKIQESGWEAFRTKDAKKFEAISTKDLSIVDPMGAWVGGQANVIKYWTQDTKCEGVTKTSASDGFATTISPTLEILTLKGSADGTCGGMKNGDLYQTAFYVKEGDSWKLAFMMESPAI